MRKTKINQETKGLDAPLVSGSALTKKKMKTYKLINYDPDTDRFQAKDESGYNIYLDLTTDSSFPEINDSEAYNKCDSKEQFTALMKSFEGRTIECEGISPYIPVYFVGNGRFIS